MSLAQQYLYNLVNGKVKGPWGMLLRGCLFILSLVYGLGVILLAGIYRLRPVRLGAKVISVGNITLGGTGKTTLVEYLSDKLSSTGNKIAILSRGYKRVSGRSGLAGLGDEPAMLQSKLPSVQVVVDKNRIKAAEEAVDKYGAQMLILDDGLQQWRIFKDLEIVTIDAANPFGNYRMLPAGFLREPLCALARADIFFLTQIKPGVDLDCLSAKLKSINPAALIVESRHEPKGVRWVEQADQILDAGFLKGKSVAIFSAIGNPEGFKRCVSELGMRVGKELRFIDHYDYTQADILKIIREAERNHLEAIITTGKDAAKISQLGIPDKTILVLEVKLSITKNEAEFNRRLSKLYSF